MRCIHLDRIPKITIFEHVTLSQTKCWPFSVFTGLSTQTSLEYIATLGEGRG